MGGRACVRARAGELRPSPGGDAEAGTRGGSHRRDGGRRGGGAPLCRPQTGEDRRARERRRGARRGARGHVSLDGAPRRQRRRAPRRTRQGAGFAREERPRRAPARPRVRRRRPSSARDRRRCVLHRQAPPVGRESPQERPRHGAQRPRELPDEHPASVVVVSDGRLDDPAEGASEDSLRALGAELHVPINTIATSRSSPPTPAYATSPPRAPPSPTSRCPFAWRSAAAAGSRATS